MRLNEGVEWAMHCCLLLAWLRDDGPVPTSHLAAAFGLPPAYLNKQLQALARADLVASAPGPRGGFRLARPAERISLLDIVEAVEGAEDVFRCQEIRQKGANAGRPAAEFREQCVIAAAMRGADVAWRRELANQSIAAIGATVDATSPDAGARMREWYASRRAAPR